MTLRVLVATSFFPTPDNPGLGSYVTTQAEALREQGLDVDIFTLPTEGSALRRYLRGALELRRLARSGRYDVLHAHYGYMGVIARMQRALPLVVTFHGSDLLGGVTDPSGRHSLESRIGVRVGQALSRWVDAAIVQSGEMARKLGGRDHVNVISHEVDLELFRPVERGDARQQLGLDPERPYLLFAAHPRVHVKRYPLAEAAVQLLGERGVDAELLTVHREPQERLALYMNACDALVFPSFQEGSPNIVKQALACNLPIVSTDVGDVRELLGDAEGCFVCPPDAGAFAEKLEALATRPRRTSGRDRVRHLTKPLVAKRVVQVYEAALARHAGSQKVESGPQPTEEGSRAR